jgi:hypothetical protein
MLKDIAKGGILFSTSKGRILFCEQAVVNAYLTGERSIFAQLQDGFGNVSDIGYSSLTYQLKNQIVKVLEDKTSIEKVNWGEFAERFKAWREEVIKTGKPVIITTQKKKRKENRDVTRTD